MAQNKVEFNDKTNNTPIVDRDRQIVAEDLNELKEVINSNADDVDDNKVDKPDSSQENNIPVFANDSGRKLEDSGKSFEDSLTDDKGKVPNSKIVYGIEGRVSDNEGKIESLEEDVEDNTNRIGVNEYEIQLLKNNQVTGIVQKNTYADLAATTPVENVSFKVTNDPDTVLINPPFSNNGYYHFEGIVIVRDADLITGDIVAGESDAVTGDKIFNYIKDNVTGDLNSVAYRSLFTDSDIEQAKFIAAGTGVITAGSGVYKLVKVYLTAGEYWLNCPSALLQDVLWKYTDDTYATPDSSVVGSSSDSVSQIITIPSDGYYAISWNDGDLLEIIKGVSFLSNSLALLEYISRIKSDVDSVTLGVERISYRSLFADSEIQQFKFIAAGTGIITAASSGYKIVEIYLEAGDYWINCPNAVSQDLMWKYTDDTYATPETSIIGVSGTSISQKVTITDAGYYAIGWNDRNSAGISKGLAFINSNIYLLEHINRIKDELSQAISDVEIETAKVSYRSLFTDSDIEQFKFIAANTGIISSGSGAYKVVKIQLEAGDYWINCPNAVAQEILWKYTDDTYTTPETRIIGNEDDDVSQIVTIVDSGYYAIGWNDRDTTQTIKGIAFLSKNISLLKRINRVESDVSAVELEVGKVAYRSIFSDSEIESSRFIAANTGVISNGSGAYKIIKVYLTVGKYWFNAPDPIAQEGMWKYTDDTYATPESRIIGNFDGNLSRIIDIVTDGYYAMSWNDRNTLEIVKGAAFLIKNSDLMDKIDARTNPTGLLISDYSSFSVVGTGWTVASDSKSALSSSVGFENRLTYPIDTFEDNFRLHSDVTIETGDSSGYFEVVFGKYYELSGTMVSIGKDATGSFISTWKIDDVEDPARTTQTYITEYEFTIGETYNVALEKITTDVYTLNATVTNKQGKLETVSIISDGGLYGFSWGRVAYYALIGTFTVSGVNWGYPLDLNDVKVWVSGHSFVEGTTVEGDKTKRFCALMQADIGQKNTLITGQGGARVADVIRYFETVANFVGKPRYVFFFLGTNDADTSTTTDEMDKLNMLAESNEIIPIWATVPPRLSSGQTKPLLDAHIRSNFTHVDFSDLCYDNSGVIDPLMYKDDVHFSIAGHERAYRMVKAKCSYLFNI